MTFPFNFVAICTFLAIKPQAMNSEIEETVDDDGTDEFIDWLQVGRGILVSMGQVYAINNVAASSLMNVAVFLSSPLLFMMSTTGQLGLSWGL